MPRQVGRAQKKKSAGALNITSMMDMFTIILLFLLKSFSTGGVTIANAEGLSLPNSLSTEKPEKINLQLAINQEVINVNADGTSDTLPGSITIDNIKIETLERFRNFDQATFDTDTNTVLDRRLKEEMLKEEDMVRRGLLNNVDAEVIVQLDKNISFDVMYKIMRVCGRNGYVNMKFAVMTRED